MEINVIDLFAGPGGLGEGFFSFQANDKTFPYKSLCSIEKDMYAHSTLRLRSFYRKIIQNKKELPKEYFEYIQGHCLYPHNADTEYLWNEACHETYLLTLGKDESKDLSIFTDIKKNIDEKKPLVLIGGPPCQAYSLVGRARNKGNKSYIPENDQRHFLYQQYLKIMEIFSPDIFIMENVKGVLSSQVNGGAVFNKIISDLQTCSGGYTLFSLKNGKPYSLELNGFHDIKEFVLASENYGIPQTRHRVIILGIKDSLLSQKIKIGKLREKKSISVGEVIGNLPPCRSKFSNRSIYFKTENTVEKWKKNITEGINKLINNDGNILDKKLINSLQEHLLLLNNENESNSLHFHYQYPYTTGHEYYDFVFDSPNLKILDHFPRPHMDSDLIRYFFCSVFRETYGRNPKDHEFPRTLTPDHKSWNSGKFVDRFKVQGLDRPSSTITSHISKDGHYFIHPDSKQCRSLTVREAARLQSFPDSYVFMGKRTNQFHQIGNAVPPFLARQIATIVYDILESVNNSSK
ncbi:DNA cytosine methyltransferase [Acinetobacter soli]|uniref:DNA cytosine methyltransferase n=1 Tax=Acinetobacter soli TaxID=487316 RepID=UPI0012501CC5|nr:DNA cytosine methyltransferase [Acinetobacter soli]MEB4802145.1 DNA cytosine methyltransferase [Acinetobacter soli]